MCFLLLRKRPIWGSVLGSFALHTTEAFVPLAREEKEFHMPNGCDSDAEQKRSFLEWFLACELSDLGRGMFEVAPRFAVVMASVYEEREFGFVDEMEKRQGHL
jgi:hypothetical protein